MQKNWFTITLVIALIAAIYLFFWDMDPITEPNQNQASGLQEENPPTAYATNIKTKKFRLDGGIDFYFEADNAEYFQIDPKNPNPNDHMILENPQTTLFEQERNSNNRATWHVQSKSGKTLDDFKLVELNDDVIIWKPESFENFAHITTSQITLDTTTQVVRTDAPVKMLFPKILDEGTGMEGDLKNETYTLYESRSVHEP